MFLVGPPLPVLYAGVLTLRILVVRAESRLFMADKGALIIIRIGFWGPLNFYYNKELPK